MYGISRAWFRKNLYSCEEDYLYDRTGKYISPREILVITFTKAAAKEMKERYLKATNKQKTPITFGTFHAVFYGILKWAYHIDASNIMSDEEKNGL